MHTLTVLLQAVEAATATLKLIDYGVLGLLATLCISVVVYQERIRRSRDAEVKKELEQTRADTARLNERFDKYQTEDRAKMLEVLQHNTDVMEEVINIIQHKRTAK